MSKDLRGSPTKSKPPSNPHQRLHNVVFILVSLCLTVQVLEGSFFAPYIFVHFGFPRLSLQEVCGEMQSTIYDDSKRFCNFPYPLFKYEPEPWTFDNKENQFGPAKPPRPNWKDLGFQDFVLRKEERLKSQSEANPEASANENKGG